MNNHEITTSKILNTEIKNNDILKALFYHFKRQILSLYLQDKSLYSESFIYAITHNTYPLFSDTDEIKMYNQFFTVTNEQITLVTKYLDEKWRTNNIEVYPTFYQLEDEFAKYKIDRSGLIYIIRYCVLDKRFDDELWKKIKSDCPCEADYIDDKFDKNYDIHMD